MTVSNRPLWRPDRQLDSWNEGQIDGQLNWWMDRWRDWRTSGSYWSWTALAHYLFWTALGHCWSWTALGHYWSWTALAHYWFWTALAHYLPWTALGYYLSWTTLGHCWSWTAHQLLVVNITWSLLALTHYILLDLSNTELLVMSQDQ